jgi:protein TonB
MQVSETKRFFQITGLTVAINILLFTGLPNLLPKQVVDSDVETIQAVHFLREVRSHRLREKQKPPEEQKPPEPPVAPRRAFHAMSQSTAEPLTMEMPEFQFDLAADLAGGIPVSAPSDVALKDFYGMLEVDQAPVATLKPRPVYPYRARRLNLDGEVDVKFLVDTAGRVSRISVLRAVPKGLFGDSVIRALSSWRFKPGRVKGRPVNTWVTTTIAFRIDDL